MQVPVKKPLAKAKDICEYFGINDVTLWRWYTLGDFPKPYYPGRDRRWEWPVIHAWELTRNKKQG